MEVVNYAKENEQIYKDFYNISYSSDTHSACNFTEFLKVSLLTATYADECFVKICADFLKLRMEIYNTSNLKGVPLIFNDNHSESNLTLQIIYDPVCQHYASLKKINMNQQYKLEQSRQKSSKKSFSINLMPKSNNGQKLVVRETFHNLKKVETADGELTKLHSYRYRLKWVIILHSKNK